MRLSRATSLLIALLALVLGCSDGVSPASSVRPPDAPEPSEAPPTAPPSVAITPEGQLSLSKDALGQTYLMQTAIRDTNGLGVPYPPMYHVLQSRIVRFHKTPHSLFLMEGGEGLTADENNRHDQILAEFPIIQDKDNITTVDWNRGMNRLFGSGDVFGKYDSPHSPGLPISHSFLSDARQDSHRIHIRQEAQAVVGLNMLSVEISYYLEPYPVHPDYEPLPDPDSRDFGYFLNRPSKRPKVGSPMQMVERWDIRNPVTYYISANTPEEYRDAVKKGILYWNKAFGKEVLKVEMAPEEVSAPHPDYNVVQWIQDDMLDRGLASMQSDPLTGQILRAQINMGSGWALHNFKLLAPPVITLGLSGFDSGVLCTYSPNEDELDLADVGPITDNALSLQFSQDVVRTVVAHEVGHTLGLRHNFAASHYSTVSPKERSRLLDEYLATGIMKTPPAMASSVMDYSSYADNILNGVYIKDPQSPALPYDEMAIRFVYFNETPQPDQKNLYFCTDEKAESSADCMRRDSAGHPVLALAEDFHNFLERLPSYVAKVYYDARTYPVPDVRKLVAEVGFDAGFIAGKLALPLSRWMNLLHEGTPPLAVTRQFPVITDVQEEDVKKATLKWLDDAIAAGGGVTTLWSDIATPSVFAIFDSYQKTFETTITRPSYRAGVAADGTPYFITTEEIATMKTNFRALLEVLKDKLAAAITQALLPNSYWVASKAGATAPSTSIAASAWRKFKDVDGLEKMIGKWAEHIVLDHAEAIPTFKGETRVTTAQLLRANTDLKPDWQKVRREAVRISLLQKLQQRYGRPFETVDPASLSAPEKDAYSVEKQILAILTGNDTILPSPSVKKPETTPSKKDVPMMWLF